MALLVCVGLAAEGDTGSSGPVGNNAGKPVTLALGSGEVQLPLPKGWTAEPARTETDGSVSISLTDQDHTSVLVVKVRRLAVEVSIDNLGKTLQSSLEAYPLFEVAEAGIASVAKIPAVTVRGIVEKGPQRLAARIYVFRASGYLWEMVLTAPQETVADRYSALKNIIAGLRVRGGQERRWARLSCSQQAVLAHRASGQRPAPDSPGATVRDLDSCLKCVAVGTRLDADDELADPGQKFDCEANQLIIYLETEAAPANTEITVQFFSSEELLLRRRIRLSGSRKFAVTISPRRAERFRPGDYRCVVQVNGEVAWEISLQING